MSALSSTTRIRAVRGTLSTTGTELAPSATATDREVRQPSDRFFDEQVVALVCDGSRASVLGSSLLRAHRNDDGHRGAYAHRTPRRHVATQHLRELVHHRQADARPFLGARAGALYAMESIEDVRQLVLGDSSARVRHLELDVVATSEERDPHPPFEGELQGVRDQVQQDCLPHVRIDQDGL
jgi:hypothetical protein